MSTTTIFSVDLTRYNRHETLAGEVVYVSQLDRDDRLWVAEDGVNLYRRRMGSLDFLHVNADCCACLDCTIARNSKLADSLPLAEGLETESPETESVEVEADASPDPAHDPDEDDQDCTTCDGSGYIKTGKRGRPPRCPDCG